MPWEPTAQSYSHVTWPVLAPFNSTGISARCQSSATSRCHSSTRVLKGPFSPLSHLNGPSSFSNSFTVQTNSQNAASRPLLPPTRIGHSVTSVESARVVRMLALGRALEGLDKPTLGTSVSCLHRYQYFPAQHLPALPSLLPCPCRPSSNVHCTVALHQIMFSWKKILMRTSKMVIAVSDIL